MLQLSAGETAVPVALSPLHAHGAAALGAHMPSAVPPAWDELWRHPEPASIEWTRLARASHQLAERIGCRHEHSASLAGLVGSQGLRVTPVHRWFTYKEGFSPMLLSEVIGALQLGTALNVVDSFGGVATTALAGQTLDQVREVRSVEYSPFAHFAGKVKLGWHALDADRLAELVPRALAYKRRTDVPVPELASFRNPRIFHGATVHSLLSAREHLKTLPKASEAERSFLLLGLAAVVEDLSGAMKDGRALRIKGDRNRKASSLADTSPPAHVSGRVKRALAGQWTAMIGDLVAMGDEREAASATPTNHVRGDARHLDRIELDGRQVLPDGWAQLALFSPPYLNCLDYTELYKLELWLMEHVTDATEFKQTRRGTLRSHPSVRFESRPYFRGQDGLDIDLVHGVSKWVSQQGARREVGIVVKEYFEDMLQVWREQLRVLAAGAIAVCVVANSTFSRREPIAGGGKTEVWRLPLLTDVVLAHLALRAGFAHVELWPARELRPRNASAGRARESLVVAWKGSSTG